MQNVINGMESKKDFYVVGSASNINTYEDLHTFKESNNVDFSLATGSELGYLFMNNFNNTFTFIGKNNRIFGTLEADADVEEIDMMLRKTIASFHEIYLKDHSGAAIIEDEITEIPLSFFFTFDPSQQISFQVINSTDDTVCSYNITGNSLFISRGSSYGHNDLTLAAVIPGTDTLLKTNISMINNTNALLDDFEYSSLDQSPVKWTSGGDASWYIDEFNSFSGNSSLRSGNIADDENSDISVELDLTEPGTVTFAYKTSSYYESGEDWFTGDFLNFYIDEINMTDSVNFSQWGGINGWRVVSFDLEAGIHKLKWQYSKNYYASLFDDTVWIDYIVLPGTEIIKYHDKTVDAGEDITMQISPNPFNPVTSINFLLDSDRFVKLSIYDSKGRLVDKLAENTLKKGNHTLYLKGDKLAAGIYYAVLETQYSVSSKKLMLIK